MVQARSGDKAKMAAAERLISAAWVLYVQTVSSPTPGMIFGYQPPRIPNPDRILYEAANAPSLPQHVQAVSNVNPIYAQLREAAYRQAQTAGEMADPRLLANMERARSIPASGRFVLVDAASQRLWMYENGHPVDSMKVVVGTIETPTPMIASMIHYATLNPYWNVPDALIRKTVAAECRQEGPALSQGPWLSGDVGLGPQRHRNSRKRRSTGRPSRPGRRRSGSASFRDRTMRWAR